MTSDIRESKKPSKKIDATISLVTLPAMIARIDALPSLEPADVYALVEEFREGEAKARGGKEKGRWVAREFISEYYVWVLWRTRQWRGEPRKTKRWRKEAV